MLKKVGDIFFIVLNTTTHIVVHSSGERKYENISPIWYISHMKIFSLSVLLNVKMENLKKIMVCIAYRKKLTLDRFDCGIFLSFIIFDVMFIIEMTPNMQYILTVIYDIQCPSLNTVKKTLSMI